MRWPFLCALTWALLLGVLLVPQWWQLLPVGVAFGGVLEEANRG